MNNFSHKKKFNTGTVLLHVDSSLITLIKSKNYEKLDKYYIEIKLGRYPTSENSDPYKFKMALFDNSNPEEFLLFVCNFNMNIEASGTLKSGVKIKYLHFLFRVEALHKFDMLSDEVESAGSKTLSSIILDLGT